MHETTNMDTIKAVYGRNSIEMIFTEYELSGTLRQNSQFGKAEGMLVKCLKKCYAQHYERSCIEEEQQVVALILIRLGDNYNDQQEFEKAKEMHSSALVVAEKGFGDDDEVVLGLRRRMDLANGRDKKDGSDIELLEKVLKSCAVDDDDEIIHTNYHLCALYANAGKLDLAMEAGLKSLCHARKTSQMRLVGDVLFYLSSIQCDKEEWDEALCNLEEALPILRADYGEKSAAVAEALGRLGEIYVHQGKCDDALKVLKKALRYGRRSAGDKLPNLRAWTYDILNVYRNQGHFGKALQMLEKEEEFFRSILPEYDTNISKLVMSRDLQVLQNTC